MLSESILVTAAWEGKLLAERRKVTWDAPDLLLMELVHTMPLN